MNNYCRKLVLLSILTLMGYCNCYAQKEWTLKDCIDYAYSNNLNIKQQEISIKEAQNNILSSKLSFVPSLNWNVNHSMSWGRSVNINDLAIIKGHLSQSTSTSVSANVTLFEGMNKHKNLKSSKNMLKMAQQDVEKLKDDIYIAICKAYLQILLNYRIDSVAQESYNSVKEQVAKTEKLVDAGSVAYSNLLEMKAQLSSEKVQLVSAHNNVQTSLLELAQLLDLENYFSFRIAVPKTQNTNNIQIPSLEEIYAASMNLPQIKKAELSLQESELQLKIAKGAAYPSLSFSAGYATYYSNGSDAAFFSQFNENRSPSIGFGLSIPIFNSYRSKTQIKNSKLAVETKQIEFEKSKQSLYKEIQQAHNDAVAYYHKYLAALENKNLSAESYNQTKGKFDLGMVNSTDFIVAKTNLFKAENECYQSLYQYIFQIIILDYYRGIKINGVL